MTIGSSLILADFKWNFSDKSTPEEIDRLHERVAWRLNHVCVKNGGTNACRCAKRFPDEPSAGLFIKLGQSIGIQAAILPKAYRDAFATIFDAAPHVPYSEVAKVFKQEFGKSPHDIYEYFEEHPMASASIAQVHRAKLLVKNEKTGIEEVKEVAVKVQKPAIKKQMNLDLWSYQWVLALRSFEPSLTDHPSQHNAVLVRMGISDTMLFHSALRSQTDAS